jgi:hypothetical protein
LNQYYPDYPEWGAGKGMTVEDILINCGGKHTKTGNWGVRAFFFSFFLFLLFFITAPT